MIGIWKPWNVKSLLVPYRDILNDLKFKLAWRANLPDLTRERYEREDGEGPTRRVIWVFVEANDAEVLWTMGWDSIGVFDMLASSMAAAGQGLEPLAVFTERLRGLVASPPATAPPCDMPE